MSFLSSHVTRSHDLTWGRKRKQTKLSLYKNDVIKLCRMCWCLTYCFSSKYNGRHFMHINCPVLYVSGRRMLSTQTMTHPMINSVILDMTLSLTTNRDIFSSTFRFLSSVLYLPPLPSPYGHCCHGLWPHFPSLPTSQYQLLFLHLMCKIHWIFI